MIHWQVASHVHEPLFAWEFLLARWPHPEFTRSAAIEAFRRESRLLGKELSDVTLEQHFDVFLHSYVPTRGRKGDVKEDNLDCPLVELELIRKTGERATGTAGHREPVYAFRYDDKPEITPELFVYCLLDFLRRRHPDEQTVSLREIAHAPGSPGQLLKLPEPVLRERLERVEHESRGLFAYRESAARQLVARAREPKSSLLPWVYEPETAHV